MKIRCKICNGSMKKEVNRSANYILFIISLVFIALSIICNVADNSLLVVKFILICIFSYIGIYFFYQSINYKVAFYRYSKCREWLTK